MRTKISKKIASRILCMMLIVAMALFTVGCKKDEKETPQGGQDVTVTVPAEDTQKDVAGEDAEDGQEAGDVASDVTKLGEGATAFMFSVVDKEGKETCFEIHTDKTIVGEALLELGLIAGDESQYGLYIKTVNGITADYDVDKTYWAFYINGEYAMTGVDSTDVDASATYCFKVEK